MNLDYNLIRSAMMISNILIAMLSLLSAQDKPGNQNFINYVCVRDQLGYNITDQQEVLIFEQLDNSLHSGDAILEAKGSWGVKIPIRTTRITGENATLNGEGDIAQQVNSLRSSLGITPDSIESSKPNIEIIDSHLTSMGDIIIEIKRKRGFITLKTQYVIFQPSIKAVNQTEAYNLKCELLLTDQQGIRNSPSPSSLIDVSNSSTVESNN